MFFSQENQRLLDLIVMTHQVTHVDDSPEGPYFIKIFQIKSEPNIKKTIKIRYLIKSFEYCKKTRIFGFFELNKKFVDDYFELELLTLMIQNNEYKYYFNFDDFMISSSSLIRLEQRFSSVWKNLEDKLNSHYASKSPSNEI